MALYSNGGPFLLPEHFSRYNLFGKFNTWISPATRLTVTGSTLYSRWRASGEIPNRAVAEGYIPSRWGALDSAQGGFTTRTNANVRLVTNLGRNSTWENQAYFTHYEFSLITNFTFFYYFPTTGDEFRQHEVRDMGGYTTQISRKDISAIPALLPSRAPDSAMMRSIRAGWIIRRMVHFLAICNLARSMS